MVPPWLRRPMWDESRALSALDQLKAAVTGLEPKKGYTLALSEKADGGGALQPLAAFMTNPAGAAIVDTVGPIRQLVEAKQDDVRRYLVIAPGATNELGAAVQVQMP